MQIRRYSISGIYQATNRRRTIELPATTEDEAREYALKQGFIEPIVINEKPPDPPTVPQIEYATSLGARIPKDASKQDLSAIIQKKLDGDSDPSQDLIDYANYQKIIFSEQIGKQALYSLVFENLAKTDRIAFFAFSIYRWLSDDRKGNLEIHSEKQKFYDFAIQVEDNEKIVSSINRYSGSQLRFFGKLIKTNGEERQGGSTNTIAYKATCDYLEATFKISTRRKTFRFKDNETELFYQKDNLPDKKGCLGVLLNISYFIFVIILIIKLLR